MPDQATKRQEPLLVVDGLKTHIETHNGVVKAVDGVSFSVHQGEIVGLVGESGCGKTMTSLSIMGLVPAPSGRIVAGSIRFDGRELVGLREREMRTIRGREISMMLQDPLTSLNPVFTIGNQVAESFIFHRRKGVTRTIKDQVTDVLQRVRIASPERFFRSYPHQFSGGMRQRVSAAIAIAPQPKLMIADEPTTALDVTTQAQFLQLLRQLRSETDLSIIYITHDLGVVARICTRVIVMYAGGIVETGSVGAIYKSPAHPYTRGLMNSVPRLGANKGRLFQIDGQAPHLQDMPSGCPFHPRCREAQDICKQERPPTIVLSEDGHSTACWFPQKTPELSALSQ